jgi:hypothetical protein
MADPEDYNVYLSLEKPVQVSDIPEDTERAFLEVSADSETGQRPDQWVWLAFFARDEPWFKLTFAEAAQVRDRLNYLLEVYDTLTDVEKESVNSTEEKPRLVSIADEI